MAEAVATGRPELATQSLGRSLTEAEDRFAEALMAIYAEGVKDETEIAAGLTARDVFRPSSLKVDWTAQTLAAELQALNADLDAAYAQNGFGA